MSGDTEMIQLNEYEEKILKKIKESPKISLRKLYEELKKDMVLNTLRKYLKNLYDYGYITGFKGPRKKAELQLTRSGLKYLENLEKKDLVLGMFSFSISDIKKFYPDIDIVELMKILSDEEVRYDLGNIIGWILNSYINDVSNRYLGDFGGVFPIISRKTGSLYYLGRVPDEIKNILLTFERENLMSVGDAMASVILTGLLRDIYKSIKADRIAPKVSMIFWRYVPEQKRINFNLSTEEREKALHVIYRYLKEHFKKIDKQKA